MAHGGHGASVGGSGVWRFSTARMMPDFNFWSGFAISNLQDDTTIGFQNQFSTYTGVNNNQNTFILILLAAFPRFYATRSDFFLIMLCCDL